MCTYSCSCAATIKFSRWRPGGGSEGKVRVPSKVGFIMWEHWFHKAMQPFINEKSFHGLIFSPRPKKLAKGQDGGHQNHQKSRILTTNVIGSCVLDQSVEQTDERVHC